MNTQTNKDSKDLDAEIRRFAGRLRKSFAPQIESDPSFRGKVIGKLRVLLPRKSPGRKQGSEVSKASEIYEREYVSQSKKGNWHEIAKNVIPGYSELPIEIQKFRRYALRASVHSHLYETRSRNSRRSVSQ